jgi:hypothetical protein
MEFMAFVGSLPAAGLGPDVAIVPTLVDKEDVQHPPHDIKFQTHKYFG